MISCLKVSEVRADVLLLSSWVKKFICIGLLHHQYENVLTIAEDLLIEIWNTCSQVMVHTSSLESFRHSMDELVSILLDSIAKAASENKVTLAW